MGGGTPQNKGFRIIPELFPNLIIPLIFGVPSRDTKNKAFLKISSPGGAENYVT